MVSSMASSQPENQNKENTRKFAQLVLQQGQWNELQDPVLDDGTNSLPMPVKIAEASSLRPFFTHLSHGGTHTMPSIPDTYARVGTEQGYNTSLIEYPKGVLYADGRLDLCKMVVGPSNIEELMASLRPNTFVKHFLLGNNIIGAVGARAISQFVQELPDRIETWYLAGNCIGKDSLDLLVESWARSPAVTNIWLKRNPLTALATPTLARLVCDTTNLRTLDLDQTGLGDGGVGSLFRALAISTATPLPIRHIYISATGVSKYACQQIGAFLASPSCALESLYMSCNPIGDAAVHLAAGLKGNKSLQRLSMSSCGLNSASLAPVLEAITGHPSLKVLEIGQAYATEDLGARFNWLGDATIAQLVFLLQTTPLQSLVLDDAPLSQAALNELLNAVARSDSLLYLSARSIYSASKHKRYDTALRNHCQAHLEGNVQSAYHCTYDVFLQKHKRFIQSPADVRLVDSVYRNRDVRLARRGLKFLDKHWRDGDDTALRAELGEL